MKRGGAIGFFIRFVLLFGFLNGLWLALGINPNAKVFGVVGPFVEQLPPTAGFIFTILPAIIVVLAVFLIDIRGGWLGFIAVGCGFTGGLLLPLSPIASGIFLGAGLLLGFAAVWGG